LAHNWCFAAPPYWRNGKPPENAIVAEDGGASFCCIADGYPKPRISWSVDGVPLEGKCKFRGVALQMKFL